MDENLREWNDSMLRIKGIIRDETTDELREEIDRLGALIDEAAKHWLSLNPGVPWCGAIDAAMEAAVKEIARLRTIIDWMAKRGTFADSYAGAIWFDSQKGRQHRHYDGSPAGLLAAVDEAMGEK